MVFIEYFVQLEEGEGDSLYVRHLRTPSKNKFKSRKKKKSASYCPCGSQKSLLSTHKLTNTPWVPSILPSTHVI